jgi:hypothetical protein
MKDTRDLQLETSFQLDNTLFRYKDRLLSYDRISNNPSISPRLAAGMSHGTMIQRSVFTLKFSLARCQFPRAWSRKGAIHADTDPCDGSAFFLLTCGVARILTTLKCCAFQVSVAIKVFLLYAGYSLYVEASDCFPGFCS